MASRTGTAICSCVPPESAEALGARALHPGDGEAVAKLKLGSREKIVQIRAQVPPHGLAIAAGRLNLAGKPADVAFELHQLGVMICERLFEALAAQLAPLDLCGIGGDQPDGCKRRGFGLVGCFAGGDIGADRQHARLSIQVPCPLSIRAEAPQGRVPGFRP